MSLSFGVHYEVPEEKVGPTAHNKQKAGKNKFDEEMKTVKHPV
jgi:hypothetical protein